MRLVEERLTVPAETRAALEPVRQQLLQLAEVVPEEAARAGPVERPRHLAVRQPLGPVPPGHGARSGHDGEHQVVGECRVVACATSARAAAWALSGSPETVTW